MTHETQNRIENRGRAMLQLLWRWIRQLGSGMMAAAVRYHDTPPKQSKPKAGKAKPLAERRKVRTLVILKKEES